MTDLTFLTALDEKRFKFIQTGVHAYDVAVFNNGIHQFSFEVMLMPTGDSEEDARYTITPDDDLPSWITQFNTKLDQHIKEHTAD